MARCSTFVSIVFLLVGWTLTLGSVILSLVKSYPPYSRFYPSDFVFYEPKELKNDTDNNLYYVIKNGSDLLLNLTKLNESECTLVSYQSYDRIVSFVDNNVILIAYFGGISLKLLSELASTFIFWKKVSTDDKKYGKPAKVCLFFIKTNFIIGTFTIAIIDYDLECFQLKVSEFFIEFAYYSIIVFEVTMGLFVCILLIFAFICLRGCVSISGDVCCGDEDSDKLYDKFTGWSCGTKALVFYSVVLFIVGLLELANLVIYGVLFLGPYITLIINGLVTGELINDIVQIFYCC